METEEAQTITTGEPLQEIVIHAGTYEGTILGFHGSIKTQKNLYAYTPNWVDSLFNLC